MNVACRLTLGSIIAGLAYCMAGCSSSAGSAALELERENDGAFHVHPGESIQRALDAAAKLPDSERRLVRVHEGVYRPDRENQALIWFNRRHDGIVLEAVGRVVLTAENENIANPESESFPAVVNHVVFFGDGISGETVLRGFRIRGANHFVSRSKKHQIEPDSSLPRLEKADFFYADGGGIKIFGRSYPTIEDVLVENNYTSPCGAGVSIEHRGLNDRAVVLRNCIFRNNRCQVTGSGVDVLPGSSAVIENCLFVHNVSNTGEDYVGARTGEYYNPEHGSGALTVFAGSHVVVERCTFTNNWNGVDDKAVGSAYRNCLFWKNDADGGTSPKERYEMDVQDARNVNGCFLGGGPVLDLRNTIDAVRNRLRCSDPEFDDAYVPRATEFSEVGYRPASDFLREVDDAK